MLIKFQQHGLKREVGKFILRYHKLISSIWKKEELPQQWKESVIVPIYKKGYKTDCSSYRNI
jgi:hypothetical protein